MRIGFTGDFHLGFATGKRKGEDFRQAERAVKKLLEQDVDAIVIMGDIFDSSVPKPEALRDAALILSKARRKSSDAELLGVGRDTPQIDGLPVIAIHGNHERRIKGETNPVQLLEYMNLVIYLHNSGLKLNDLGFFGVGAVPESIAPRIIRNLKPKPFGKFSFFLFHQNLRPYVPARDSLSFSDLPAGFNYYINGHIHTPRLEKNLLLTGSTIVTQLKPGEEKKYVWVWEDGRFVPIELEVRPFVIVRVNAMGRTPGEVVGEIEKAVENVIEKYEEEPLVKVVVEGKLAPGFKPADLVYRHEGKGIVYVEKRLEGELGVEVDGIKKMSVDELVVRALGKILSSRGVEINAEELYRAIMRTDSERIWELLQVVK